MLSNSYAKPLKTVFQHGRAVCALIKDIAVLKRGKNDRMISPLLSHRMVGLDYSLEVSLWLRENCM